MRFTKIFPKPRGFTLLELLLVLAMIALVFAIGGPISTSLFRQNNLQSAAETTAQFLSRAQLRATAVENDSPWGVALQNSQVVLFQGTSFANRDSAWDEVFEFSSSLQNSGLAEIIFAKLSGEPSTTGQIVFTDTSGDSKTLTLNSAGVVDF